MRIVLILGILFVACFTRAQIDLDLVQISDGWVKPTALVSPNDGTNRLFVVEQGGLVWIITNTATGQYHPQPFLDLTMKVTSGGERGLLGLAFHPDYPTQPYVFVNYTIGGAQGLRTRIERYTVLSDPNQAMSGSGKIILEFSQPYGNHNGGDIAFGPDGYLYIATGDGGGSNDPQGHTQDYTNLLGNILRIDIDNDDFPQEDLKNYGIPCNNPFVDSCESGMVSDPSKRGELWALGLRNPWRISFDQLTGDLYIADVGQNAWEEVNRQPASSNGGEHYGWSCREGANDFLNGEECTQNETVDPFFQYSRGDGISITGGYVYRGSVFPLLEGKYFCADYHSKQMWMVDPATGLAEKSDMSAFGNISTFGQMANGEIYVATHNAGGPQDKIYRLINKDVCPDRIIVDAITKANYIAENSIESTASVETSVQTTFQAGQEVLLQPQFNVQDPAHFEVIMQSCIQQLLEQ